MSRITIELDEDIEKVIAKRAKKNLFSLEEQIIDILRKSAVRTKAGVKVVSMKVDDALVGAFSRERRGRKGK